MALENEGIFLLLLEGFGHMLDEGNLGILLLTKEMIFVKRLSI
jgi:hypothetical protein